MRLLLFILSFGLLLVSCDNTLDVNAEYKDIPIVYGMLNPKDTAQYIKLERVFQANGQSAFEVAQNIDSLYYPNAIVSLTNERINKTVILEKVDGALEGYPRDGGVFALDPNYLYKAITFELDMKPGDVFRLDIKRDEESKIVTSSVRIVEEPELIAPQEFGALHFATKTKLNIKRKSSIYGKAMDVVFYIHVFEVDHSVGGSTNRRTLEWHVVEGHDKDTYSLEGNLFYSFIAANLENNDNITRTLLGIDVKVVLGGEDIYDYIRLGTANSFSITSSEAVPNYSNISEGFGILSSLNEIYIEGLGISKPTADSLENGKITKNYNFSQ